MLALRISLVEKEKAVSHLCLTKKFSKSDISQNRSDQLPKNVASWAPSMCIAVASTALFQELVQNNCRRTPCVKVVFRV